MAEMAQVALSHLFHKKGSLHWMSVMLGAEHSSCGLRVDRTRG